jgi:hypothetical protein
LICSSKSPFRLNVANSASKAGIRSGTQIGGAFAESYSDASRVNFKEPAPNKQHLDDINESTAFEFYKKISTTRRFVL